MRIKVKGEMTIAELKQALFEQLHELEVDTSIRFTEGATLYINPTNGFGDKVRPCNRHGKEIKNLYSNGPYKSAADEFKL